MHIYALCKLGGKTRKRWEKKIHSLRADLKNCLLCRKECVFKSVFVESNRHGKLLAPKGLCVEFKPFWRSLRGEVKRRLKSVCITHSRQACMNAQHTFVSFVHFDVKIMRAQKVKCFLWFVNYFLAFNTFFYLKKHKNNIYI